MTPIAQNVNRGCINIYNNGPKVIKVVSSNPYACYKFLRIGDTAGKTTEVIT